MSDATEIVPKQEYAGAVEVREQVNAMQHLMQMVLKEGTHYGRIPGTGKDAKPSLLQPGAEKIGQMFHLVPTYDVNVRELPGGHREYDFTCRLTQRDTGQLMGMGYGLCSTMESKYRYRNKWVNNQKVREENPDIADTYNTVFKMAKKRAFVDAVKSTTAASDIFTQDVEDMPAWMFESRPAPVAVAATVEAPRPDPEMAGRAEFMREMSARLAKATGTDVAEVKRTLFEQGDFRRMDADQWEDYRFDVQAMVDDAEQMALDMEEGVVQALENDDAGDRE